MAWNLRYSGLKLQITNPQFFWGTLYISSSYVKIWGGTKFQLPEYPLSGLKAMSIEREKEWMSVLTMVSTYTWTKSWSMGLPWMRSWPLFFLVLSTIYVYLNKAYLNLICKTYQKHLEIFQLKLVLVQVISKSWTRATSVI